MLRLSEFTQRRLAVYVVDAASGVPRSRVPVYAEAVIGAADAAEPPEDPFKTESLHALAAANETLATMVGDGLREQVAVTWARSNPDALEDVTKYVIHQVEGYIANDPPPAKVGKLIREAVRVMVVERSIPGPTHIPAVKDRLIPLGLLATDHAGFASWDLDRVAFRDLVPAEAHDRTGLDFRVYPRLLESERRSVLEQNRVAEDAIVCRIELSDG